MQDIKSYLDISEEKTIFTYGEYDAWSSTAAELNDSAKNRKL
jgi:hypothetical protein